MNYLWQTIKEYFSPNRTLNSNDYNDKQQQSWTRYQHESDIRNQNRLPSMGFPTFSDPREIFSVFEEQMNQMMESFKYQREQFDGNEYFYENRDDSGNYIKVYRFESGPYIFQDVPQNEIEQKSNEPENIRDIILKPEYRKKKKQDDNLDGKIGIEDIRKRFF